MNNNKLKKIIYSFYFILSTTPLFVYARPEIQPYTGTTLNGILVFIRTYLLSFSGAIAILFIVIGGAQMLTSSGNPQRLETAKKTLTYAVGGLLLILLAGVILRVFTGEIFPTVFTGSGDPY